MQGDEREFDDPALRAALGRALVEESAPPALRSRVESLVTEGERAASTDAGRSPTSFRDWWARWQSPIYGSIAAAVVVLGVGLVALQYTGTLDRWMAPALPPPQTAQLPKAFGSAMVTVHNTCAGMSDHHLAARSAGNDLNAVKAALAANATFPVVATSPGEGWVFKGAGQCPVGGSKAVHLLFARGSARVSVFSFPATAAVEPGYIPVDGMSYASVIDGQPVAGFVYNGGLHCIVGSGANGGAQGAPALKDVSAMRDLLASTCGASSCSGGVYDPPVQTATNAE